MKSMIRAIVEVGLGASAVLAQAQFSLFAAETISASLGGRGQFAAQKLIDLCKLMRELPRAGMIVRSGLRPGTYGIWVESG